MPSKQELLSSIQPGMKLTKEFMRRAYGYELSYPGFAEQALSALESAGCSKARQYYSDWVTAYEEACKAEIKPVAHWYRLECEKEWSEKQKEGEATRKQKELEYLQRMSNRDLIDLLGKLIDASWLL